LNGRYLHRVHIRGKPDATELKIYGLADERSYLYAFKLYEGQHETTQAIVEELVDQLPNSHYEVYADAWNGGDSLAFLLLLQKGFLFTLACEKNRPSEVFDDYPDVGLIKGQCRYLQSERDASSVVRFTIVPNATSSRTCQGQERQVIAKRSLFHLWFKIT